MFGIGDYIIYGSNGVCTVDGIGPIDLDSASKDKLYYTLSPYYAKGRTIFTPVDNQKVIMRSVMSKEEGTALIDEILSIEYMWIPDEKKREMDYKAAMKKCDCREFIKIIKTIHLRKESRIAEGKKLTSSDEKYFKVAEDNLYGELAISFDMTREEVEAYVVGQVRQQEKDILK